MAPAKAGADLDRELDYEALGLVAGLEIHQQLETATKLFCGCPTRRRDPADAVRTVRRYLHPTTSELGELDRAALEESQLERTFEYLAFETTCLVEEDDEPPGTIDEEALEVALEIAALLDVEVVDQAHVMRKIVVDGSNTTGFQRSMLLGTDGEIEVDGHRIGITDLMLEEESAQRLEGREDAVTFGLDRLGIPLVEIGTAPDLDSPEVVRRAAEHLGMLLRSTGAVKRGLGTIRQDVNVSISDGARVELKGVQRLEDLEAIVAREVHRQVRLLELRDRLRERDAGVGEVVDVTASFEATDSGVVRSALAEGGRVLALALPGFDGIVGAELGPDRRLGSEFADHARRHGAGGIFHTDELPAYGIGDGEVAAVREAVDADPDDAVVLVADEPEIAEAAVEAVAERARAAIEGVPEETRGVAEDATSRYLRPLPGAARMYPETDVPPVEVDPTAVEAPALLTERVERYETELGLDPDLAEQVAFGPHMPTFERAIERGIDATLAAGALTGTLTGLRRDDVPVERLEEDRLVAALERVQAGELPREALEPLLRGLAEDPTSSIEAVAERLDLGGVDEAAVRETVRSVVERNEGQVREEGMAAFSGLMGECMAELRGKADGELVSAILREEIEARTGS